MKKLIGIVPKGFLFDPKGDLFSDVYHVENNCSKRIAEAGGIPLGIAPVDGRVTEEMLAPFDGFIVQGGRRFWPYHYQIMHHAVTHGKRVLGLCLGMQLIHSYFKLCEIAQQLGRTGDMGEITYELLRDGTVAYEPLEPVEGHRSPPVLRGQEASVKHGVEIIPDTVLHRLMGREKLCGATYHSYRITAPVQGIRVNAWAADGSGTIEGIEYGENILGVQFHPEIDGELGELFTFLTRE